MVLLISLGAVTRARIERDKTVDFLLGLDDEQFRNIRSQLIGTEPVPDPDRAYFLVTQEERHRHIIHNRDDRTDSVAFVARPDKRPPGPSRSCSHCGRTNHSVDTCFELIGFPAQFARGGGRGRGSRGGSSSGGRGGPRHGSASQAPAGSGQSVPGSGSGGQAAVHASVSDSSGNLSDQMSRLMSMLEASASHAYTELYIFKITMMRSIKKLISTPRDSGPMVPVPNTTLQDQEFEKEIFIDPVSVPDDDLIIDPIDVVSVTVTDIVINVSGDDQRDHTIQAEYSRDGVIFYGCTETIGTSESDIVVLYDSGDVTRAGRIFFLLVLWSCLLGVVNALSLTDSFDAPIIKELKDQMASRMFNAGVNEGQSTTRPPLFDGTNYSYWKERMRIFIQSNDYKLWLIVKNGCGVPMKKVGEVNIPKTEEEFTDEGCKKMELNAKAINMIYCGVNADDYRKISQCETAKQMWEKLEVTYEGTTQVREAKIDHLTHEYELFSMKENEKIEEIFEIFSNIINPLNLLGKTYTDRELVRKVVEERNKRSIALPATTSTHNNVDDEDDDSDDTDLGLFVRKFKKMMLKKGAKKNTPPKCYRCGEIGQIKPMCPKLKNEKVKKAPKKQRAYISWENDGSGSEDSETEEVANLCLMSIEDSDTSKEVSDQEPSPNDP
ncbi:unnamed protein product [Cuscuta campestris]|uniref:CCHC-type domain-containing protein n=1 Tax=Cuscuta campestris TaxID=132261 RepID=A0A484MIE9_9ASTE|nr:unnamed protein product [Cuscuta campestris]